MQDKKRYYLGIDIGGSHYAMGIVDTVEMRLLTETVERFPVDSGQPALAILNPLVSSIREAIEGFGAPVMGIGISVPGPFDYDHGVSHIRGLNKYDSLFGVNLKLFLWAHLQDILESSEQITCLNDADSFVLGETYANNLAAGKVMGVTLGTGIGSGFVVDGKVATEGGGIPGRG